jgi:hypothetical protein
MDRNAAQSALGEIEATESRTGQAVIYGQSATHLLLWGALVTAGNIATQFLPDRASWIWGLVWLAGGVGAVVIGTRQGQSAGGSARIGWNIVLSFAALIGFGMVLLWLFSPVTTRQLSVFWPMLVMLCYIMIGIWVGRFFAICGLTVFALTVIGYLYSGPWLPLWMAAANGGALILTGLYLRRIGLQL